MQNMDGANGRMVRHLRKRCQQRGTRTDVINLLLSRGDRIVAVGGGRKSITLTRREAGRLRAEGFAAGVLDRVRKRAVVIDENGDAITVVIPSGRRGRHYRRGVRRRRRRARR
jgi:hypothetical protein